MPLIKIQQTITNRQKDWLQRRAAARGTTPQEEIRRLLDVAIDQEKRGSEAATYPPPSPPLPPTGAGA